MCLDGDNAEQSPTSPGSTDLSEDSNATIQNH